MEKDEDIEELQEVVKTECLENIGYFKIVDTYRERKEIEGYLKELGLVE